MNYYPHITIKNNTLITLFTLRANNEKETTTDYSVALLWGKRNELLCTQ